VSRSVSDLLDENGKVDTNKVRSISNRRNTPRDTVDDEACATWRRDAVGAPNVARRR